MCPRLDSSSGASVCNVLFEWKRKIRKKSTGAARSGEGERRGLGSGKDVGMCHLQVSTSCQVGANKVLSYGSYDSPPLSATIAAFRNFFPLSFSLALPNWIGEISIDFSARSILEKKTAKKDQKTGG